MQRVGTSRATAQRATADVLRSVRLPLTALLLAASVTLAFAGWSFDTNLTPEAARDLLAAPEFSAPPAGSWLRLRDLPRSAVRDDAGTEVPPWPDAKPAASIAERRAALNVLRDRGYHLVAIVQWPAKSWAGGVRPDQPLRRLPLDLREAADRCRRLAAAYGDLIDYWEIENEPDISFVEENPETYAAFLKACYLAFKTKPETGDLKPETPARDDRFSEVSTSGLRSQVSGFSASRVLNAAFALPPGPYFDAWIANDGLRYTDGFNYHYYGYAEDFTGVYRQFQAAVTSAPCPAPADTAVFQTQFYPSSAGWQAHVLSRFGADEGDPKANRTLLLARPLAREEPTLAAQGRWLASPGTSIRESAEGWEFTIAAPAPGPLRPAMAELPLPAGWSAGANASLAFEYRAERPRGKPETGDRRPEGIPIQQTAIPKPATAASRAAIVYPQTDPFSGLRSQVSGFPTASLRKLPIFLTEYGYGLLGPESRLTTEGRADQRRWFETVQPQIASLGIEGAMAFVLTPYLEAKQNEFGLLMSADSGPRPDDGRTTEDGRRTADSAQGTEDGRRTELRSQVSGFRFPRYSVSPALDTLLKAGRKPVKPKTWNVVSTPPTAVVLDFVADASLTMAKSRQGYLLEAADAAGRLVLYNFGSEAITGELTLDGAPWSLADGTRSQFLQLSPGERRELPVKIHIADAMRFGAQVAKAKFVAAPPGTVVPRSPSSALGSPPSVAPAGPPSANPPQVSGLRSQVSPFEVYLRTANGNLYQTWPRLQAQTAWQWYVEPFASFTPAFFGRAHLPSSLSANEPVALVFFFRPTTYPAVYQVRHASAVEFLAPPAVPVRGKR